MASMFWLEWFHAVFPVNNVCRQPKSHAPTHAQTASLHHKTTQTNIGLSFPFCVFHAFLISIIPLTHFSAV